MDTLTRAEKRLIVSELKKQGCYPVFLTSDEVDAFYSGYSNSTLWLLFHYFPSEATYADDHWLAYQKVNRAFAKVAHSFSTNNAKLWVHDYQLMLVPQLLRSIEEQGYLRLTAPKPH